MRKNFAFLLGAALCAQIAAVDFSPPLVPLLPDDVYEEPVLRDNYFYLEGGTTYLVLPTLGMGWRWQRSKAGFDLSIDASLGASLRANASLMFYPKPNLSEQWYGGLGASALTMPLYQGGRASPGIGPTLMVGKSHQNEHHQRRFFQATIDVLFASHAVLKPMPYFSLMYGWGF